MNKEEIKCLNCVKFKTQYCPCTIDCMATETYPFYQDRRMMLEENTNLKQALNDIYKYIKEKTREDMPNKKYLEENKIAYGTIKYIIDKVLGDSNE